MFIYILTIVNKILLFYLETLYNIDRKEEIIVELVTWKCKIKNLNSTQYEFLREMCHLSKNIYNESIYNIRQHYFAEGSYLRYEANFGQMKTSENYIKIGSNVAQATMRDADQSFKSFFGLLKKSKQGVYANWKVRLPHYLKKDAFYPVEFIHAGEADLSKGRFKVPTSKYFREKYSGLKLYLNIPKYIQDKKVHTISIVPEYQGKYFEYRIVFEDEEKTKVQLDSTRALAIDLGINNFATCVTSEGKSFIIDGKKVKSINQWYNKENARLQSVKDKQKINGCTKRQYLIASKRERKIQNFIYNSAKYIVNYCIDNQIGNIVVGYNDGFQDNVNLGRVNNQQFVMLPYGKFKSRLEYLCNLYGIKYKVQEESYTSKASFWDKDEMPKWNPLNPKQGSFSGKRIKRGLYQTKSGNLLNADVNGALNILRKSNVVSLETLYSRGEVLTPTRIRLA